MIVRAEHIATGARLRSLSIMLTTPDVIAAVLPHVPALEKATIDFIERPTAADMAPIVAAMVKYTQQLKLLLMNDIISLLTLSLLHQHDDDKFSNASSLLSLPDDIAQLGWCRGWGKTTMSLRWRDTGYTCGRAFDEHFAMHVGFMTAHNSITASSSSPASSATTTLVASMIILLRRGMVLTDFNNEPHHDEANDDACACRKTTMLTSLPTRRSVPYPVCQLFAHAI